MSVNIHRWSVGLAGLVLLLAAAAPSRAQHPELIDLLRRVPDSANALVFIKADALFDTPLALRERWRERRDRAPGVVPDVTRGADYEVFASRLNLVGSFERDWELALAHLNAPTTAAAIARGEGGTLDELGGRQIVWSPRGAFIVPFTPRVVGMAFFDNRQDVSRWIVTAEARTAPALSPFLTKIAQSVHGFDHQVVMAFDLTDLVPPRVARTHLAQAAAINIATADLDAMAAAAATAEGIVVGLEVSAVIEGLIRIDFGGPTAALRVVARPLTFEILGNLGLPIDAMRDWRIAVEDRSITLRGRLTTEAARDLVALIDLPAGGLAGDRSEVADPAQGGAEASPNAAPGSPTTPTAEATKSYFDQMVRLMTTFRRERSRTQREVGLWGQRYAAQIDRLPMLGVDPELLDFSAKLSASLRDLGNTARGINIQASLTRAATTGTRGGGGFYGVGFGWGPGVTGTSKTAVDRHDPRRDRQRDRLPECPVGRDRPQPRDHRPHPHRALRH